MKYAKSNNETRNNDDINVEHSLTKNSLHEQSYQATSGKWIYMKFTKVAIV